MTIMEAVRAYLKTCPLLEGERLNVDFLPEEAGSYSLETVPVNPVLKRYITGDSLRQFSFVLASRALYGEEIRQQLDNLGFFEAFNDWLDRKSRARDFPDLGPGRAAVKLEATTSGYAFAPGVNAARYQIQCRLLYEQAADYEKEI